MNFPTPQVASAGRSASTKRREDMEGKEGTKALRSSTWDGRSITEVGAIPEPGVRQVPGKIRSLS